MKINKISIKYKILLLVSIGIILLTGGIIFRIQGVASTEANQAAVVKAVSDLELGYEIIDLKFPGDWELRGDQLYKGERLINDNNQLVDQIGKLSQGNIVTIFAGETRVATNVQENGSRAVGTPVSAEVKEKVFNGQRFTGAASVLGRNYQTAYMPLRDEDNQIVGIWSLGTSTDFVETMKSGITFSTAIFALIAGLIFLAVVFAFVLKMTEPLKNLSTYAEEIAAGNLSFEIKSDYLKKEDEIGILAASFKKMRDNLKNLIGNIDDGIDELSDSSQELTATGEELSASAEEVGNSIQQIASGAEEQSAASTKSIANLIASIQKGINQTVNKMKENELKVEKSVVNINNTSELFNEITAASKNLDQLVHEIDQMSREMNTDSKGAKNSVKEIAVVSEEAAYNAEGVASASQEQSNSTKIIAEASEDLTELAKELSALIKSFKVK